jgi:hypothetical protein
LPHSEIPGSTIARISPGLIAACHVLHRLSTPRHSPDALHYLFLSTPHQRPTRAFLPGGYRPSACLSPVTRTRPSLRSAPPRTRALPWREAPPVVRDDRRVSTSKLSIPCVPNPDKPHRSKKPPCRPPGRSHSHSNDTIRSEQNMSLANART